MRAIALCMFVFAFSFVSFAQDTVNVKIPKAQLRRQGMSPTQMDSIVNDSLRRVREMKITADSLANVTSKGLKDGKTIVVKDTDDSSLMTIKVPSVSEVQQAIANKVFIPNPHKAMWLAIAFPGAGQIYNRKYWKLPLIYGGFLGCVYALSWNDMMYHDYSQAYIDIMDDDPNTKSYENFIPRNYNVDSNLTRIQNLFKRKKDYYRRYRDLSLFCMIGVYALSIIDAYVDAELSSFDISHDLSMKVRPSIIHDNNSLAQRSPYSTQSYGVRCSLNF